MSSLKVQRSAIEDLRHIRNVVQQLERQMPNGRGRPALDRQMLIRNLKDSVDEAEENLKHYLATGEWIIRGGE